MRLFVCALVLHAAAAFVAPRPPRPAPLRSSNDFENPNPFMKDVIDAVPTLQEGRTMQLVLGSEEPTPPSDAEQQKLRAAAADELRNIDGAERARRLAAGRVLAVVTLLQSAFLCASHAAFLPRLSLLPGLFLSLGLYDSAKTGLWNIAQSGLWDVAGTGLERVPDAGVAKQILDRVNSMNVATSLKALAVTVLFASAAFLDPLAR